MTSFLPVFLKHRCSGEVRRPESARPWARAWAAVLGIWVTFPSTPGGAAVAPLRGAEKLQRVAPVEPRPTTPRAIPYRASDAPIHVLVGPYEGWERCVTIRNGQVEALVVPAIGRVMRFQFIGQDTPFWEDPALHGQPADASSKDWINFGGDKTWPSPQADWEKMTGRGWPPPVAFDSLPIEAVVRRDTLVLSSPVDPHYGIRTERVLALDHDRPVLTITTTYEKVAGDPVRTGVWIITQLRDPLAVYVPLPPGHPQFPEGYLRQSGDDLPAGLKVEGDVLSLTRDPARSTKIGTAADRLLWVGAKEMLLIESPRLNAPGTEYPDGGSSAEIYTNPNPKTYVELEMLGPLQTLRVGDRLSQTNIYRLFPRRFSNPARDAQAILSRGR